MLSSRPEEKDVRGWLELDYVDRPSLLARCRKYLLRVSWWGGLVAGLVLVGYVLAGQPRRAYTAGPVSTAHAMFADDCSRCHTGPWRTAERWWNHDDALRSVPDTACLACHGGALHNPGQVQTPGCVTCHREHRGHPALARVADTHCTACHAALESTTGPLRFAPEVRSFPDGHPEFGRWRGQALADGGTVRFNHQVHLRQGLLGADRKLVTLDCTGCHRPDAAGRYMLPIRYSRDCAGCHPLSLPSPGEWADRPLQEAAAEFRRLPAPHPGPGETAEKVHDILRGRLLALARLPNLLGAAKADPADDRLSGWRRPEPLVEKELDWVNDRLGQVERVLFDHGGGCAYCHRETTPPARRPDGLPRYAPPNMADRWFPQSRFSHEAHRMLQCLACHEGARDSTKTADVLLPAKATCQECHSPRGGARTDCPECHGYHDPARARSLNGTLTIERATGRPVGESPSSHPTTPRGN
jgi:hypothetical protein